MTTTSIYPIYRVWELAALLALAVVTFAFNQDAIGTACFLAFSGYIGVRDWRGLYSLRGRIPWQRIRGARRGWAIVGVIVFFPWLLAAYVLVAAYDAWVWHKSEHERILARIDELERELGIRQADDDGGTRQ